MTNKTSSADVILRVVNRIDQLIQESEAETRPLELEPARSHLFEMFVFAEAAGLTGDTGDEELSADGLCRRLSNQWGLAQAAQSAAQGQAAMGPREMSQMRLLWSVMRMWMEWTYAWKRWDEFHQPTDTPVERM